VETFLMGALQISDLCFRTWPNHEISAKLSGKGGAKPADRTTRNFSVDSGWERLFYGLSVFSFSRFAGRGFRAQDNGFSSRRASFTNNAQACLRAG